jgi:hypothetical protein
VLISFDYVKSFDLALCFFSKFCESLMALFAKFLFAAMGKIIITEMMSYNNDYA